MWQLNSFEILTILGTSTCPKCHQFIYIETKHTEDHVITTSGKCDLCRTEYMIDRSYPAPFEILSSHGYELTIW